MEDDKEGDASSTSVARSPLQLSGALAIRDSEEAEALADSPEAQFQPVNNPSDAAFTAMVDVAMRAYE
jgi:hypothetical protein